MPPITPGPPGPTGTELCRPVPPIAPDCTGIDVARLFEEHGRAAAFAVVVDGRPVGLIDRLSFISRFASLYGRDLYGRRTILHLMDPEPLVVEAGLPPEQISDRLFTQKPEALQTGFIMVRDGFYAGIVTGVDLLRTLARSLAASNAFLQQAQADLVQSEKMAALGGLVAGIAHEINTPIGSVLTAATAFGERARAFAGLASNGSIRRSDIDRFVGSALQAAEYTEVNIRRASELISGFKQIAVDQTSDDRRRFSLRQCLEDVLLSLQPRLRKEGVAIGLDCPGDVELDSYPGALAQIVTNLVMNAVLHAFDGRENGTLSVAATVEAGEVRVLVADDGCGIPAGIRSRIFDPFFTTRRGTGGSGLGLHIVFNLASQRLGGAIAVESSEGEGSRFLVSFPATAP